MTAHSSASSPSKQTRGRAANVALWVLQVLVAAAFALVAAVKLSNNPEAVAAFDVIGAGQWLRYGIGTLELAGAVGLLIPQLSGLAGLGFTALMVGAVITDVTILGHAPLGSAPLLILSAIIAIGRWPSTVRLFSAVLGR